MSKVTRIDVLDDIINRHIDNLNDKENPNYYDTKTLTEVLKAILVLENIKKLDGKKSSYDSMSVDELEDKLESFNT